jgi:signal transduction histidine kinase
LARAVAAFRILALGYALVLVIADHHHYDRPSLAWALLGAMAVWTAITAAAYDGTARWPGRWPWWLLATDVAIAVGMVLATVAVESHARISAGAPTLPAAWVAAPVLICAIAGGPWLGGLAALALSAADVTERSGVTQHTFNGVVLLLMAGVVGGYVVRLGQRAQDVIEAAARRESATAQRDRLAREIHDSVLQVLALVARRGAAIGGETAELAALAAAQEAVLRQLVAMPVLDTRVAGEIDLRSLLSGLGSERVTVSNPADPVMLGERESTAVVGAVSEALSNVERHGGPQAHAWVLIEALPDEVTVTVRDNGQGIADGRLTQAAAAGRLGVSQSMVGRIEAIGGVLVVTSAVGAGTEVEIRVPR